MTPEQKAAYVMAQSVAAMATIEGMKAENRKREARGDTLAWNKESFDSVIENYGLGHNQLMGLFRD